MNFYGPKFDRHFSVSTGESKFGQQRNELEKVAELNFLVVEFVKPVGEVSDRFDGEIAQVELDGLAGFQVTLFPFVLFDQLPKASTNANFSTVC